MTKDNSTYISTDIEADGPIPGPNSMLSLGSAAFNAEGTLLGTFSANLDTLKGATQDPDTMAWWATQPEAWETCRKNTENPETVMREYSSWVSQFQKPVFVGYPAGFDFLFVYWYLIYFTGKSPFSFSALDIKTYAAAKLNLPYREAVKRNYPKKWFSDNPHTHVAVEDATEQGLLFINMLKDKP